MNKEKLLKIIKDNKSSIQVDKYYKCIQNVIKNDPVYYYNKDYVKKFIHESN